MQDKRTIEPNVVYSREETASLLGVSLTTVKRLIAHGHLRVSRPQGMRRMLIRGAYILKMLDQTIMESQA